MPSLKQHPDNVMPGGFSSKYNIAERAGMPIAL
jgi:hypothetical protein